MSFFLDRVSLVQADLDESANLHSYAAKAALDELATNWRAAIGDNANPADLIADIDEVVELLISCKATLALPQAFTRVDLLTGG